ncbi:MAG: insulinase family protein [Chitinivibrionia bacterium]|nr:insulinase family protein [Chitinivibrionia bacterium]
MANFQDIKEGDVVGGFLCNEVREIKERNSVAYIFEHQKTKAKCVHWYNDDKNNLFSIGFRTPVFDHTGVPHILEHAVLAGSKKYPLKDPFKELLKSSMYTFLNAMTYPDRTIYPVSSQVPADFFNLTDVYCDAVFNPVLSEYTFAQEGWHFDVENENADKSDVSIKGIVYNEMKGVFSDFNSFVGKNLYSGLFPDTTYFFESGGDPKHIPELTYENFKNFHQKYYHPSNSFIVLYGNINSKESLERLNDNYLKNFDELKVNSQILPQKNFEKPQKIHISAPSSKEDNGTATVLLSWIWREKQKNEANTLELKVLSSYLLSGENAPLKKALLDSDLGEDIDDLSGIETELYAVSFVVGLKKTKPKNAEKIVDLIKSTIKKEAENGFDKEAIEGILRQMEFKIREIGGDASYPLSFATRIYKFWIYDCDPVRFLQFEEQFAQLRKNITEKPRYLENLLEELTLKNKNELLLITEASAKMGDNLGKLSREQAKKLSADFTKTDLQSFAKFTKELNDYQQREHTSQELSCIPLLKKSDIPTKGEIIPTEKSQIGAVKWLHSPIFTGGVFYLNLSFDFSVIPNHLLEYFPLYTDYLGRCGAGGLSAAETAKQWKLHSGGFWSDPIISASYNRNAPVVIQNSFGVKTLEKNIPQTLNCLSRTLFEADFSDTKLIKNVINETKNGIFEDIIQHGHTHAIMNAAARFSTANAIKHRIDGIGLYKFLKNLRNKEKEILAKLQEIHSILINSQGLTISTSCNENGFVGQLEEFVVKIPSFEKKIELTPQNLQIKQISEIYALEIPSSVNYAAKAFELQNCEHKFVGEVKLLSQILAKGYLWDKIRVEGGAYGGFCSFNQVAGIFAFGSFRDPNISKTFDNFAKSLSQNPISQEIIDRAIPSVIGGADAPKSPAVKTRNELFDHLCEYTNEDEQKIREAILNADENSIKHNIDIIIESAKNAQKTVLGSKDAINLAKKEGLTFKKDKL